MTDANDLRQRLLLGASWDALGLELAVSVDKALDDVADWLRERAIYLRLSADTAENQTGRTILSIRAEAIDRLADSITEETGT